ncbi:MAG: polysaccharide pyruvyl transferase family protein [Bacteroidales bacterium]|nr:polysaccharide pyruvyl transferase family protein [Bacteroidales bacterium]
MFALITCYFQPNYGSQLQAFTTQMAFDKLGIENETIRIDGLLPEINKAKYKYFLSRIFDMETVKDKMATVRKYIAKKCNSEYAKNLTIRYKMFEDFASTKFILSERYNNKRELTENAHKYSAFVVGSDQLWLPSNIAADYYTLNFVPVEIPKISLATSFGISKLPKNSAKLASKFLNRFNHISVRETSGQKIAQELTDKDIAVVCDPTIMFTADDWTKALDAVENGNRFADGQRYIFVYFLGNNPWQRDVVKNVQKETGLKFVQIAHSDEYVKTDVGFADFTPYNVGPKEFVELIRDAEFVFTDSFHCSIFSMLNHKKFFTFPRYSDDGTASTNGRLYSLLSLVKHESRMVRKSDAENFQLDASIKYEIIDSELEHLRRFTWQWLENALKESNVI